MELDLLELIIPREDVDVRLYFYEPSMDFADWNPDRVELSPDQLIKITFVGFSWEFVIIGVGGGRA